jgi:hypothetical protein
MELIWNWLVASCKISLGIFMSSNNFINFSYNMNIIYILTEPLTKHNRIMERVEETSWQKLFSKSGVCLSTSNQIHLVHLGEWAQGHPRSFHNEIRANHFSFPLFLPISS